MPYSQRSVFGANWIYVGRTAQCSEPGQYFSGNVGREPFIVAGFKTTSEHHQNPVTYTTKRLILSFRDGKGTLRAFYDVCRHHAAKVSPEEGEGCVDK